ncbi:hypothetical protein CSUI_009982, partial [Cystoisospora suis]
MPSEWDRRKGGILQPIEKTFSFIYQSSSDSLDNAEEEGEEDHSPNLDSSRKEDKGNPGPEDEEGKQRSKRRISTSSRDRQEERQNAPGVFSTSSSPLVYPVSLSSSSSVPYHLMEALNEQRQ